jgi:uncharacterized protein (TIGR00299 family) protein
MSRRSSTASDRSDGRIREASRVLHLDAFSGVAGNMLLGALLDLGLRKRVLLADLAGLDLPFQLVSRRVRRGALTACWVDVRVPRPRHGGRPALRREAAHAHSHALRHDHGHLHRHADRPARSLPAAHHSHAGGRPWSAIRRILASARLASEVRERALAIFSSLAEAEARVHGIPIARVHFHEVGAVDAIVDVTGVAAGLHRLGVRRVTCSPLPLGTGTIESEHGRLPLPAPATLELLRGIPVVPAHIAWETVTPTGAAIVRGIVDEFRPIPAMTVEAIGLGAGNDRSGGLPNVLRAVLGREEGFGADRVTCLETHVDDLNPEHFEYLMERLFEAGALDVALQHLQMKKNRPGFLIRVVARPADRLALAQVLFAESTTIGVRVTEADRLLLEREERRVSTPFGAIRVKVVRDAAGKPEPSAEYEDCKRAARRAQVPLREVVRAAEEAARALVVGVEPPRRQRGKKRRSRRQP